MWNENAAKRHYKKSVEKGQNKSNQMYPKGATKSFL